MRRTAARSSCAVEPTTCAGGTDREPSIVPGAAVLLERLGGCNRLFDVVHRVAGKILRDLTQKGGRQLLVVVLAQLTKRPRGGDDKEVRDLSVEHLPVQKTGCSGGEAVLFGLALVGIAGAALMPPS